MHEQAHLDRYDDWSQLLEAFVGSLAGLHPAVGFLMRRLDLDREAACDDRVVSYTGATRRYAFALLAVAAASTPGARRVGLGAATTNASALRVRVSRILDPGRARSARVIPAARIVSVAAMAVAVVMLTQVAPIAIFLETPTLDVPRVVIDAAAVAIEMRLADQPVPSTNLSPVIDRIVEPPDAPLVRISAPAQSDPPETAAPSAAGTTRTRLPRCRSTAASFARRSTLPRSRFLHHCQRCRRRHCRRRPWEAAASSACRPRTTSRAQRRRRAPRRRITGISIEPVLRETRPPGRRDRTASSSSRQIVRLIALPMEAPLCVCF